MRNTRLFVVILGQFVHAATIFHQTVYDVVPATPHVSYRRIGDSPIVYVKSQCAVHCQQNPRCKYFAVCMMTSRTTPECVLLQQLRGSALTSSTFNVSHCVVFTEKKLLYPNTGSSWPPSTGRNRSQAHAAPYVGTGPTSFLSSLNFSDSSSPVRLWGGLSLPSVLRATPAATAAATGVSNNGNLDGILWYHDQVVLQVRSVDGCAYDFNRSWAEYSAGFGSVQSGCFWLGNSNITYLTTDDLKWDLYIALANQTYSQNAQMLWYDNFEMDDEDHHFRLQYGSYHWESGKQFTSGSATSDRRSMDGFGGLTQNSDLEGHDFYTYDNDNSDTHCARKHGAGWWYNKDCSYGNLNRVDGPVWPDETGNEVAYELSFMGLRLRV